MTDNTVNTDAEYIYNFDSLLYPLILFVSLDLMGTLKNKPAVSEALGFTEEELYARPISSFV
jgi:hypothetical protein